MALSNLEKLSQATYVQSSQPASPTAGESWYDTSSGVYRVYDGGSWKAVPPIQVLREATTFQESGVTVTTSTGVHVYGNSITLAPTYTWFGASRTQTDSSFSGWENYDGVYMRDDGLKLYATDGNDGEIIEYDLSTAYDLSTNSRVNAIQPGSGSIAAIDFKGDGRGESPDVA